MIENFTNLNGTAPIIFKPGKATITRIPDAMISYDNKEQRKATKHEGDIPIESTKQWAERREKIRTAASLAIFEFESLAQMNQDEENAIINSLAYEIYNNLKDSKIFKKMDKSAEDKLDMIKVRVTALKASNPENFKKLSMNKLKVLVTKDTTVITENDIDSSDVNEIGNKMNKISREWEEELIKKAEAKGHNVSELRSLKAKQQKQQKQQKQKTKSSNTNKPDKHKEKYLKYKAKYLALKAKLGL
jgi:hypothetical protein